MKQKFYVWSKAENSMSAQFMIANEKYIKNVRLAREREMHLRRVARGDSPDSQLGEESPRAPVQRRLWDDEESPRAPVQRRLWDDEESPREPVQRRLWDDEESPREPVQRRLWDDEESPRTPDP